MSLHGKSRSALMRLSGHRTRPVDRGKPGLGREQSDALAKQHEDNECKIVCQDDSGKYSRNDFGESELEDPS